MKMISRYTISISARRLMVLASYETSDLLSFSEEKSRLEMENSKLAIDLEDFQS